jgi:hypothetical protein
MNRPRAGRRRPAASLTQLAVFLLCILASVIAGGAASRSTMAARPGREITPVSAFPPVAAPDPIVAALIDQVTTATLTRYVGDLSGEHAVTIRGAPYTIRTRRVDSQAAIQNATYYVGDHLAGLGLNVEYHEWDPKLTPNVIGELRGETEPQRIYMLMAHLDDVPASGAVAPGADDNASGVAVVLAAADILSQYRWGCTLRFALWNSKEVYLRGSAAYANRAANRGEDIAGSLNLDMIGWNTADSLPHMDLHATAAPASTLDLAGQLASVVDAYDLDLIPTVYPDGLTDSDHASFWDQGYPAVLITEDVFAAAGGSDLNPYYHTVNDLLARLDTAYLTEMAKLAVGGLAHMSGCLLTGELGGPVSAAHDGSAIGGASLTMTDAKGHTYIAVADATGSYAVMLPAATYTVTATAYGYLPAVAEDVSVSPSAVQMRALQLQAAPPAAPTLAGGLPADGFHLTWPHVSPNTAYHVYRSLAPYFPPTPTAEIGLVSLPFAATVSYGDAGSAAGDPAANHFYLVTGVTPGGQAAASNRVGEFDFRLTPGS